MPDTDETREEQTNHLKSEINRHFQKLKSMFKEFKKQALVNQDDAYPVTQMRMNECFNELTDAERFLDHAHVGFLGQFPNMNEKMIDKLFT